MAVVTVPFELPASSIGTNVNCHKFSFSYFPRSSLHCMHLKNQLGVKTQMYKNFGFEMRIQHRFRLLEINFMLNNSLVSRPFSLSFVTDSISLEKFSLQFSKLQNLEWQTKRTVERRIRGPEK